MKEDLVKEKETIDQTFEGVQSNLEVVQKNLFDQSYNSLKGDYSKEELRSLVEEICNSLGNNSALVGHVLKSKYLIRLKKGLRLSRLYPELLDPRKEEIRRMEAHIQTRTKHVRTYKKDLRAKRVLEMSRSRLAHLKRFNEKKNSKKLN